MLSVRNLFYLILLHLVISSPQINLDLTDWVSGSNDDLQHDCLHIAVLREKVTDPRQIISYCMSEWPSNWTIQNNSQDKIFTFDELFEQNIASQQLYLWSAPIDVVEQYQLYLNRRSTSNEPLLMAKQLFYNCTSPRFGPQCQYSLDAYELHHLTLKETINNYYRQPYEPTILT
jgi:hypothetical protein